MISVLPLVVVVMATVMVMPLVVQWKDGGGEELQKGCLAAIFWTGDCH
jgi:hypothetical protein